MFSPVRIRDYRDFCRYDARYGHAHWLYQHNGGVFLPPWGKMEQWTLTVQHRPTTSTAPRPTSTASPATSTGELRVRGARRSEPPEQLGCGRTRGTSQASGRRRSVSTWTPGPIVEETVIFLR